MAIYRACRVTLADLSFGLPSCVCVCGRGRGGDGWGRGLAVSSSTGSQSQGPRRSNVSLICELPDLLVFFLSRYVLLALRVDYLGVSSVGAAIIFLRFGPLMPDALADILFLCIQPLTKYSLS